MIIKVCGMRDSGNIREVASLGADWIGLIFHPQSPRYVPMVSTGAGIIPDRGTLSDDCGSGRPLRVGVFVDDMAQNIITHVVNFNLDLVQLHGHETPTLIRNLRKTLVPSIRPDLQVIKTISISAPADFARCAPYEDCTDYFLFDTRCPQMGGSGQQFDWSWLGSYTGSKPFLLSGGIGPDDAGAIRAIKHPLFAGIDLNSRFEIAPGLKDAALLRPFIQAVRAKQED